MTTSTAGLPLSQRHQSVREAARWLTPNTRLDGIALDISVHFEAIKNTMLDLLEDGPQLVLGLHALTRAKDNCVRQAIADSERKATA